MLAEELPVIACNVAVVTNEVISSRASALASFEPDVVLYLAGVDPAAGDRYGRLALTPDGLRRRDRYVVGTLRDRGLPVVLLLAGGYAASAARTAELHANTFHEAAAIEAAAATGQRARA